MAAAAAAVDLKKLSLDGCHGYGELQLLGFIGMQTGSIPFYFRHEVFLSP